MKLEKIKRMVIIGRWKKLITILTRQRVLRIMCRWQKMARLIVKLYPTGVRPVVNVAYKKYHLKICCRWNRLTRLLMAKYPQGTRPIQQKKRRL